MRVLLFCLAQGQTMTLPCTPALPEHMNGLDKTTALRHNIEPVKS